MEHFDFDTMTYRRTLRLPHGPGLAALTPRADHVEASLRLDDLRDLPAAVARIRWLFDLDADPVAVDAALSQDAVLAPLVAKNPGRRVPRTPDGAELAVRAVLGQQVSTAAARRHAARLVAALGEPLASPGGALTHLFPTPAALAEGGGPVLRGPARRARTVEVLAHALAEGDLVLEPDADRVDARRRLEAIPGIGPWTSATVAMRALGDPDAFVVDDLGVRAAAAGLGLPANRRGLLDRSASWSPWRAYATQYLWGSLDHPVAHLRRQP